MKKTLLAGLATLLFFLTSIGIAKDWPLAQEDMKNSKATGLYDNVTILQEQINSLTERLGRIETLHEVGDRFTDMGDGTIRDNDTHLIWARYANCWGKADWQNAKKAVAEVRNGMCGLQDGSEPGEWKLPTRAEWEAFMSKVYREPALVNTVGDGRWSEGDAFYYVMSVYFWSRTAIDADTACYADMGNGETYEDWKLASMYIWPVRKEHRFKDMGDGTIRDNVSGLIWLKDASCGDLPHTDEYGRANWEDANVSVEALEWGICGLYDGSEPGDWRLPDNTEWAALTNTLDPPITTYRHPTLVNRVGDGQWEEGNAFNGVASKGYWSSEDWGSPHTAFCCDMSDATSGCWGNKDEHLYVWPVRSGK